MNYDTLINKAIEKNEVVNLLRGERGYEVENSEFVSDIFPTDINSVFINCFYKQAARINSIGEIFINALEQLICGNACDVYIAVLYFDTYIFHEKRGRVTFAFNKKIIANKLKTAINNHMEELKSEITFSNGMTKKNPLKNIENFNSCYLRDYGFGIL